MESPGAETARLSRSSLLFVAVAVACAGVLWLKLDSLSEELARHQHGPPTSASGPHAHAHAHPHSHEPAAAVAPSQLPHQHGPFHAATHPPSGTLSLVPEWAPLEAVAVALPELRNDDAGYLKLLGDLAEVVLERTALQLVVVIEQSDVSGRAQWDAIIAERGLPAERIRFLEAKALDSIWIRDYGPIFVGRAEDSQLFVVDAAYRDVRLAADETLSAILGIGPSRRPADDLVPVYFATYLGQPFVHPGFAMNGGDLYADGRGWLYTSEETLHLNTGDRDFLAGAFRQYFGVRKTCYLQSLPGPAVKHIDMLFKLASPDTCLVGQYRPHPGDADLVSLQRAAASLLDENARRLAEQGLRVVRVPMPDITKMTRWDYFGRIYSEEERETRVAELAEGADVPAERIRQKLHSKHEYVYRTFLNSVLLVSRSPDDPGQQSRLLVVPRYPDVVPEQLEAEVQRAYREAYGEDLQMAFVDAESLAPGNGSLRCIVCPLPARRAALPAANGERKPAAR